MAKAQTYQQVEKPPKAPIAPPREVDPVQEARAFLGEMTVIALPTSLLRQLSEEAARRNMSTPELFRRALADFLERTDPSKAKE